jgi:hypothetical protein
MFKPALLTLLLAMGPAVSRAQDAPLLAFPVECVLGDTCYIQQFMDRDPGPGARDFTCGPLSYDGHSGTDIALPTLRAMEAGVNVLAAAPGRVRGVRDGMADQLYSDATREALAGRDCGNGVAIDHGNGWETQYCHLALGSVAVRPGDMVETGDVLGRIGLSGRTQFPHLHLSLRHNGEEIDPFGPGDDAACALAPAGGAALWSDPVPYVPGGLLALAFADHMPDFAAVKAGTAETAITRSSDVIVIHALVWGVRAGDVLSMQMTGPGDIVVSQEIGLDRTQAQAFRAIGKRRPNGGWPAGRYEGRVLLMRGNDVLGSAQIAADVP